MFTDFDIFVILSLSNNETNMDNIIRRSFSRATSTKKEGEDLIVTNPEIFHSYGLVAGHIVGLAHHVIRDRDPYIMIVLKALDGGDHVVASFSDNAEGRFHADVTAMAILRSLNVMF